MREIKVTLIRGRATDPAVNKTAEALSEAGYKVKLLVWDRQKNLKGHEDKGYTLQRFGLNAPYDKYSALLFYPVWWVYVFVFLVRYKSNVIHTCDLDMLIPAIPAKLVKRAKLCYTIYDFYANNLPGGSFMLARKLTRKIIASVEKFGIRFTQVLFLADESRCEEIKGAKINSLIYMYNSPKDYCNTKARRGGSEAGSGELTVFYAGLVTKLRGLEYMMKAVEDLDGVRLIMAGACPDKEPVASSACQCKRIEHIGWLPSYEDVLKRTFESDILFRFSDPMHPKTKYESPNKLFEAMMCEKPIIVSDYSSMANIVREENCGLIVPYGDVDALKEALVRLKDVNLRQQLGSNGRRAYEQKYSWSIMQRKLLDAYAKL